MDVMVQESACHGNRVNMDVICKSINMTFMMKGLTWQKGPIGCHDKRFNMAVMVKGSIWMSW